MQQEWADRPDCEPVSAILQHSARRCVPLDYLSAARGGDDDEHISLGEAREALASMTVEEVRAAASSRLDPARIRVVVRGDPSEVGDSLAARGLGAVGYDHREYLVDV
ncbi:MAG: hypothetical protein U0326_33230 [Polyangiales bacterium]